MFFIKKTMITTTENNKTIARKFLELVSEGNVDEMCNMITNDWAMIGGPPDLPKVKQEYVNYLNI